MYPAQKIRKVEDEVERKTTTAEQESYEGVFDESKSTHEDPKKFTEARKDFKGPDEYENLFLIHGLSKHSTRPTFDSVLEPPQAFKDFMSKWLAIAMSDDGGDREQETQLLNQWALLDDMVEAYMPARLDLNNWVGRLVLRILSEMITGDAERTFEFHSWHQGLGWNNGAGRLDEPNMQQAPTLSYIGEPSPGRIVWAPLGGVPRATSAVMVATYDIIYGKLLSAEWCLVGCAKLITAKIKAKIVDEYVKPESERLGRLVLDHILIDYAVREVLGEAWFDLPFDVAGELRDYVQDDTS